MIFFSLNFIKAWFQSSPSLSLDTAAHHTKNAQFVHCIVFVVDIYCCLIRIDGLCAITFFFVCEIEHMRMKNSNHYRFSEYLNATIRHECIVQSSFYAFQCSVAVVAVRVVVVVAIFSRLFLCCIFDFDSNVYDSTSDLFFLHPCVFRTISFIVRIYVHIPNVSYNCTVRLWCCCCRCYIWYTVCVCYTINIIMIH